MIADDICHCYGCNLFALVLNTTGSGYLSLLSSQVASFYNVKNVVAGAKSLANP